MINFKKSEKRSKFLNLYNNYKLLSIILYIYTGRTVTKLFPGYLVIGNIHIRILCYISFYRRNKLELDFT